MFRIASRGLQCITRTATDVSHAIPASFLQGRIFKTCLPLITPLRTFSACLKIPYNNPCIATNHVNTLPPKNSLLLPVLAWGQPERTIVSFSAKKGKRKTKHAIVRRFYRLEWGGWIRPRMGRDKRLWSKWWRRRQRDRRHLIVESHYSRLFDHMTARFWRKPKYYIDDPYEPYHKRYGVRKTTDMYINKPLMN